MSRGGAGLRRGAKGDDRAAGDKARPVALLGAANGVGDRLVVVPVDPFGDPAIAAEPQQRVIGKRQFGRAIDRY